MTDERKPSLLDRALRLFTDVRAGEGANVVILAVNVFLLLTAYYVLKPVREGLLISQEGPAVKAYMAAAMAFILVPVIGGYGKLADRLPRRRLINVVTVFFAACCVVFYLVARAGVPIGVPFFIWLGIFNAMIIAQFWGFANDLYTNEAGERLFPIVQVGGAAGAIVGAVSVKQMIGPLGLTTPLLVAGGILLASLLLTNWVDRRERLRTERERAPSESTAQSPAATGEFRLDTGEFRDLRRILEERLAEERPSDTLRPEPEEDGTGRPAPDGTGAFALVMRTRYLLLIAMLVLLLNWVNTNGEALLGFLVDDAARGAAASGLTGEGLEEFVGSYVGAFYADFFYVVNTLTFVLQFFVVSRVIKYLGVHVGIMVLPAIALGSYGLIAMLPVLAYVRWAKTAENATDYSLQNTVQQALFLPTTREQKYKAKQVTDAFSKRIGDSLSGVVTFVVVTFLGTNIRYFALLNVVLVAVWLVVAFRIGREYRRLIATGQPPLTRPSR